MLFEHTTLAATASALVEALKLYGCDAEVLFRRLGLDFDAIRRPGARYRLQDVVRMWEEVRAEVGDPAIGIAVGQNMRPSALHALGLSWISSPTVLDGLRRVQRYARVTNTVMLVDLREVGDTVKFALREVDEQFEFLPENVDTAFSVVLGMCRSMLSEHFSPLSVEFEHADNGRIDRYIEFFKCPIRFSASENAMYFSLAEVSSPAPAGNQELAYANDRVTEQYLASLDPDLLQDKVREILVNLLPSGNVSQKLVAKNLHRSVSTVQRQLRAEGVSFRSILDETRAELAQRLVTEREYSLAEIAYLLGFADQANFSRAFRRWFGATPSKYRLRVPAKSDESKQAHIA